MIDYCIEVMEFVHFKMRNYSKMSGVELGENYFSYCKKFFMKSALFLEGDTTPQLLYFVLKILQLFKELNRNI